MTNTIMKDLIIDALITKGVMRVDAEEYLNQVIKTVINFGASEELAIKKIANEMEDTHFVYHHTDIASMQALAAHAATLSGWYEEERARLVDDIRDIDYTCTSPVEILNICGYGGGGHSIHSKVFKRMMLTSIIAFS